MGLRIATNIQSLSAQRNLSINSDAQKGSLEKLASGSRIVRAADDAAGLAISEKMRATIRTLAQNVRNTNDGISLIQTAEGGMNEISNILVRFRELSVQAASDTISDVDREFMNKEFSQLHQEINRIASATEFNGKKILNGDAKVIELQLGQNNDISQDRLQLDFRSSNVSSSALGLDGIDVKSKGQAQENLARIDDAIKGLSGNRADLGALQNRLKSISASLQIYNENLSTAKSRIKDVDLATETSEMAKNNILSQATISVLSQANQNPNVALKLLG